jgi:DNA polymerase-3 subunit alpha
MTALLTVERGNTEKVGLLVGECRTMGIDVLPPSVNRGGIQFTMLDREDEPPAIQFSLSAIKNVGEGPISLIEQARQAEGPFEDIDDFCNRVDLRQVGRRALEGLIKVGALDEFAPRPQLLAIIDRMINLSSSTHKAASVGQMSMFDLGGFDAPQTGSVLYPPPEVEKISKRDILSWEKELVGTYLSAHPIQRHMAAIKQASTTMLGELTEAMHGQQVSVAGLVNFIRHHQTKKGDPMAFVEIEDIQTTCEIVVFPRSYAAHRELLVEGNLIFVRGKVDAKDGRAPKVLADSITTEVTTYSAADGTPADEPTPPPARSGTNGLLPETNGRHQSTRIMEPSMPYMPPPPPPADDEATPPKTTPAPRWLHVTLRRTDNLAQDKHLMKMVYSLLSEKPGDDHFSLYVPSGRKKIRIDFPNQTTQDTAHLRQRLTQLLGPTALKVD